MVTVVGTDVTAPVKPNGTFVLTNVPPGDIQLRFTGPGTDALLTVTGVNGGDELRIDVEVSGSTATLQSVSRKDKLNKVEIEGAIVSRHVRVVRRQRHDDYDRCGDAVLERHVRERHPRRARPGEGLDPGGQHRARDRREVQDRR